MHPALLYLGGGSMRMYKNMILQKTIIEYATIYE
jgi:hypothetical protein